MQTCFVVRACESVVSCQRNRPRCRMAFASRGDPAGKAEEAFGRGDEVCDSERGERTDKYHIYIYGTVGT
jgi:hypothetical protein